MSARALAPWVLPPLLLAGCYDSTSSPMDAGIREDAPPSSRDGAAWPTDAAEPPDAGAPPTFVCRHPVPPLSDPERTWSASEPMQGSFDGGASWPSMAIGATGDVFAAWFGGSAATQGLLVTRFTEESGWAEPQRLGVAPLVSSSPAIATGAGAATAVWQSAGVLFGARWLAGAWGAPEPIGAADAFPDPSVAVDRTGRSFAVWVDGGTVRASVTGASAWSAPVALGASVADHPPSLVVDPCGNALVAFMQSGGGIMASFFVDDRWHPATRIPESGELYGDGRGPGVALSSSSAIVVWVESSRDGLFHSRYEPRIGWTRASAAAMSVDGGMFAASVTLDGAGDALAVWGEVGLASPTTTIRSARLAAGGTWTLPERIGDSAAHPMVPAIELVGDHAGEAVAVWPRSTDGRFEARTYRPGRGWGVPESFTGVEHTGSLVGAAMGPAGHAAIGWVESDASGVRVMGVRLR